MVNQVFITFYLFLTLSNKLQYNFNQLKMITMDYSNINYLAVLAATFAAFILGSLWYTVLFGQSLAKRTGFYR